MSVTNGPRLLLVALLCWTMLTACGKSDQTATPSRPAPVQADEPAQEKDLSGRLLAAKPAQLPPGLVVSTDTIYASQDGNRVITLDKAGATLTFIEKGVEVWKKQLDGKVYPWQTAPDGDWIALGMGNSAVLVDAAGQVIWEKQVPPYRDLRDLKALDGGRYLMVTFGTHDYSGLQYPVVVDLTTRPPKEITIARGSLHYGSLDHDLIALVTPAAMVELYRLDKKVGEVQALPSDPTIDFLGFTADGSKAAVQLGNIVEMATLKGEPLWQSHLGAVHARFAPGTGVTWALTNKPDGAGKYMLTILDSAGRPLLKQELDAALSPFLSGVSRNGQLGVVRIKTGTGQMNCVLTQKGELKGCYDLLSITADQRAASGMAGADQDQEQLIPFSVWLK